MKKIPILFILILILLGVFTLARSVLSPDPDEESTYTWEEALAPVDSLISDTPHNHLHGIGYDNVNKQLFLATHFGLFILQSENGSWQNAQMYKLGKNNDDFMGFSLHPNNPDIIYTSGHPVEGGNAGVMRSRDGGLTFDRVFSNIGTGRVDFHSMTISLVDPNILYGAFQGKVYRTFDSGEMWETADANGLPWQGFCWGAPCLSSDALSEETLYAGTARGLAVSQDHGDTWEVMESDAGAVTTAGTDNSGRIWAFTERHGVAVLDEENNWISKTEGLGLTPQEYAFAFVFDSNDPDVIFFATTENRVFYTANGGETWEQILK